MVDLKIAATSDELDETKMEGLAPDVQSMLRRWVYVRDTREFFNVETCELRRERSFDVEHAHLGNPDRGSTRASRLYKTLLPAPAREAEYITFRPGGTALVAEARGVCVNIAAAPVDLPLGKVDDEAIAPWLDLLRAIIPDDTYRTWLLDWMTFVCQSPTLCPEEHPLIGAPAGVRKDLLFRPLAVAIGRDNVRSLAPSQADGRAADLHRCKLLMLEELAAVPAPTYEHVRRLIEHPPATLRIRRKFEPAYTVPNVVAFILKTNSREVFDLIAGGEWLRAYWSPAQRQPEEVYAALARWLRDGGATLTARWLLARDFSPSRRGRDAAVADVGSAKAAIARHSNGE